MKLKDITLLSGALFFGTVALTSCADEETYDVDGVADNYIFINQTTPKVYDCELITNTPLGVSGYVGANVPVRLQYVSEAKVHASVEGNTSFVEAYNTEHNTEYKAVSADVAASLVVEQDVIEPGQTLGANGVSVMVPEDKLSQLADAEYLLPVHLLAAGVEGGSSRPVSVYEKNSVAYIKVHPTEGWYTRLRGSNKAECAVVTTPVGIFGGVDAAFNFEMRSALPVETKFSATVDNSLIAQYNQDNGTNYLEVPQSVLSKLKLEEGVIAVGEASTSVALTANLDLEVAKTLTEPAYIIPLKVAASYGDKVTDSELTTLYIVITNKTSFINDDATEVIGSLVDFTEFTPISVDNFSADNYTSLKTDGYWMYTDKAATASFTLDLKNTRRLSSFMINGGYVAKGYTVYVSDDNATWTELGKSTEHKGPNLGSSWRPSYAYVLYGAVPCRYVKVDLELDANHSYWNYRQYGSWYYSYSSLTGLNLYFAE